VHVDAAATPRDAHLWLPEPDPSLLADHQPHCVAMLPALDDRESEELGVKMLRPLEVGDFEDELIDAGDRDQIFSSGA
jgi:hypothetical protein